VLNARELLDDNFATDLIALRACSTGLSAPRERGDELDGLSRALLYAGARALIASLWNVDQESSQALFARFYHHWNGGLEKWRALALAQREMLTGDDPARRHPYHWAPLILVGDWR
jgi:CHAT domain-containing protein